MILRQTPQYAKDIIFRELSMLMIFYARILVQPYLVISAADILIQVSRLNLFLHIWTVDFVSSIGKTLQSSPSSSDVDTKPVHADCLLPQSSTQLPRLYAPSLFRVC